MDGQRSAILGQQTELGDELLGVLMRAVHIVPTSGDNRQLVGGVVSLHKHFRARLGGSIWVCGFQRMRFRVSVLKSHR